MKIGGPSAKFGALLSVYRRYRGHDPDAGASGGSVPPATAPDVGMATLIPIVPCPRDRLLDLLPRLEVAAGERQRPEGLPLRLDQVEVGSVLGLEDELPAGAGQAEEQDVVGPVRSQVVHDGVDPVDAFGHPLLYFLEEI